MSIKLLFNRKIYIIYSNRETVKLSISTGQNRVCNLSRHGYSHAVTRTACAFKSTRFCGAQTMGFRFNMHISHMKSILHGNSKFDNCSSLRLFGPGSSFGKVIRDVKDQSRIKECGLLWWN